jgi:hypothetical protein
MQLGYKQLISLHISSVMSLRYFVITKTLEIIHSDFTIYTYLLVKNDNLSTPFLLMS